MRRDVWANCKKLFDSEEQWQIAIESIDKAYEEHFGKSGIEDFGNIEAYADFIENVLLNSDESCFHGSDDEIRNGWYDTEIFE